MLRRRWTRPARSSAYVPASSGPRWVMTSRIRVSRARSSGCSRSDATMPAMPHMLDSLRVGGANPSTRSRSLGTGRGLVDELAEPQLEHQQLPEPVPVIGTAVAVLGPEPGHFAVVENAAVAQPAVGQQSVGHRGERTAQPLADRRL